MFSATWDTLIYILKEEVHRGVRLKRSFVNLLNWRLIRALGELQILTRASYVMLIVVPILAASWPAVRLIVNQPNKAVIEAQRLLDQTAQSVDETLSRARHEVEGIGANVYDEAAGPFTIDRLEQATSDLLATVSQYTDDYARRSLESPLFPWSFAAAFFAALFVISGHLIYQLLAPETVRRMPWDDFVVARKEEYSKHPSQDALTRAREYVGTRLGQRLKQAEGQEHERLLAHLFDAPLSREKLERKLKAFDINQLQSLEDWIRSGESAVPSDYKNTILEVVASILSGGDSGDSLRTMTTIERGARAEYLFLASRNFAGIVLTGILYLLGVAVLFGIVRVQVFAVIEAADWDSVSQLFAP